MIVELNKIYILSAPKASEGMTPGDDDFTHFTTDNLQFVKMKRIDQGKDVDCLGKVFGVKDLNLQAVMFFTDLPMKVAKQRINETVKRYVENASKKR